MMIEPFKVSFPAEVIDDLRHRLEHTRWPDQLAGTGWELGTELDCLRQVCD
jgi:hypothetical protein